MRRPTYRPFLFAWASRLQSDALVLIMHGTVCQPNHSSQPLQRPVNVGRACLEIRHMHMPRQASFATRQSPRHIILHCRDLYAQGRTVVGLTKLWRLETYDEMAKE